LVSGGIATHILTQEEVGCEWSAPHPSLFTFRERTPLPKWVDVLDEAHSGHCGIEKSISSTRN